MPDEVLSQDQPDQHSPTASASDDPLFPNIDEAPAAAAALRNGASVAAASDAAPARLGLVLNIPVRLSVELGRAELPIRDVVGIDRGSVIELDRSLGQPLDVRVNGVLIGHGEIVVVDEERLGLRFVDVVSPAERVTRLT